jgi:predicted ATPase/transcriptional regulator with XRE-family HTH domain
MLRILGFSHTEEHPMDEIATFGSWLKARRRAVDLTQADLARRVGCTTGMIKKIEQEERRPSRETALRLAQVLELPAAEHDAFVRSARGHLSADRLATSGGPGELPPLRPLREHPGALRANLPLQLTPFIGREQELAALHQRLLDPQVRLLTLTGPGGSGKTRLALAVAEQLVESFRDGVTFVAFAHISDPELVLPTIARTLGLLESDGPTLRESLNSVLRTQQRLLLLDNFEQVLAAITEVATLLAAAPGVKVLVTSRSVLHLVGEHNVPVLPLALPDPQHLPDLPDLARYEAVALFVQQARAVKPDFHLTRANAAAVAEICVRLDGLPLAIELAAARSTLLTPQALAARLDHRLRLLTGGARDRPARHQTLRGAIDWSYDLLGDEEKALFRRLGVFVGSWTVEATEAVCNMDTRGLESLDVLQSLLDTSLIWQTEGPEGEPRLLMLETIREYALEQLAANGELEALRQQHAAYYLALSETAAPEIRGPRQAAWLARLELEHNKLRGVLAWSLAGTSGGEQATIGLRLAVAVWDFWARQSFGREGRRWLADLLAHSEGTPIGSEACLLQARALLAAGNMALYWGDVHGAQPLLDESQALFQALGDTWGTANVLQSLG